MENTFVIIIALVTKSWPTLGDLIDCSPPGSSLCLWYFPGKNIGVGCHFLLQGIFPTLGWTLCLLHRQADSLLLSHQGSLEITLLCLRSHQVIRSSLQVWRFSSVESFLCLGLLFYKLRLGQISSAVSYGTSRWRWWWHLTRIECLLLPGVILNILWHIGH